MQRSDHRVLTPLLLRMILNIDPGKPEMCNMSEPGGIQRERFKLTNKLFIAQCKMFLLKNIFHRVNFDEIADAEKTSEKNYLEDSGFNRLKRSDFNLAFPDRNL